MSGGPMSEPTAARIKEKLAAAGLAVPDERVVSRLAEFVSLILRWNAKVNLTSIRDEEGIISRHIIESIIVSNMIPASVTTLLDLGSGAGLPGIPIAVCHPGIEVTLAESQNKKAAFLMEAVRVLGIRAKVHAGRAEELMQLFDCVTLRAVDKMGAAVSAGARLLAANGLLVLMTTAADAERLKAAAGAGLSWGEAACLHGANERLVEIGKKQA